MQGITGVDDTFRLVATFLHPPFYCGHSCNYIIETSPYSPEALLVLLNSSLYEWRFRVTSTNNNVNSYEVHSLPIPLRAGVDMLPTDFDEIATVGDVRTAVVRVLNSLDGITAWERMVTAHPCLTEYGRSRLRIGESRSVDIQEADAVVDNLIWTVFGLDENQRPRFGRSLDLEGNG